MKCQETCPDYPEMACEASGNNHPVHFVNVRDDKGIPTSFRWDNEGFQSPDPAKSGSKAKRSEARSIANQIGAGMGHEPQESVESEQEQEPRWQGSLDGWLEEVQRVVRQAAEERPFVYTDVYREMGLLGPPLPKSPSYWQQASNWGRDQGIIVKAELPAFCPPDDFWTPSWKRSHRRPQNVWESTIWEGPAWEKEKMRSDILSSIR